MDKADAEAVIISIPCIAQSTEFGTPRVTFWFESIVSAVDVALSSIPVEVKAVCVPPFTVGVVSVIESETLPVFILVRAIGYSPSAFAACEAA
mgnify:CR=1 FL=1